MFKRYIIVDPRPVAEENPYTFYMPCEARREAVSPGDFVKVIFADRSDDGPGERMWVKVTGVNQAGQLVGTLDNDPVVLLIERGDEIVFDRHAIIDIQTDRKDDPEETSTHDDRVFHRCWIDKRVWEDKVPAARASNMHKAPEGYGDPLYPWGGWMIVGADWDESMLLEMGTPAIVLRKDNGLAPFIFGDDNIAIAIEKSEGVWKVSNVN